MTSWNNLRWALNGAVFEPGKGGISRVVRMTARTLIEAGAPTDMVSLLDNDPQDVAGQMVATCRGSRARFFAKAHMAALRNDICLYDAAGPARAHPRLPFLKKPYGVWMHGIEVWDHLNEERKRALTGADFVLVNSGFTLKRFEELHFPLPKAHVCLLATDEDHAPAMETADGPPTALFIGRNDKDNFRKGQVEVIAAWEHVVARVPDARLRFMGGGDGLDLLKQTVAQSPVSANIEVLGFVPEEDTERVWAETTAFVQPSWKEGFGLVYIEAMRHAKPVIASIHDAGGDVNDHGTTGFNVDLNSVEDLSGRIVELLSDPDKAKKMGQAGLRRWQDQFRFSAFSKRLSGILEQVAGDIVT